MHAFRIFLLLVVIVVGTSEGLFLKKDLLKKKAAVKLGFLADVKAAALKFKAGAALKKDAILGGFKAVGKAKLGILGGIKAAKLKFLAGIASVKLAKLAALKAGKLAFVKTLAFAKLAPFVAKKVAVGGGAALLGGGLLKGGAALAAKPLKSVEGIVPFLGGGAPSPLGLLDAVDNPLTSALGGLVSGAFGGSQGVQSSPGAKPNVDLGGILGGLGNLGGLSALLPQPGNPTVNINNYRLSPAPASESVPAQVQVYGPPAIQTSYGSPSPAYGPPVSTYV